MLASMMGCVPCSQPPRQQPQPRPPTPEQRRRDPSSYGWRAMLAGMMGLGIISILLFAKLTSTSATFWATSAIGVLVAGGASIVGALLGFLFGIPRSLQQPSQSLQQPSQSPPQPHPPAPQPSPPQQALAPTPGPTPTATPLPAPPPPQSVAARQTDVAYGANTNLEQISDWLTKILLGAGLTQLAKLPQGLSATATYIGGALASAGEISVEKRAAADGVGYAIVVYFTVCGFLFSYLWSRLYLGRALTEAETIENLKQTVVEHTEHALEQRVSEITLAGLRDNTVAMALTAMGKDALFTDRSRALEALRVVRERIGDNARRDRQLNLYTARLHRLQGNLDTAIEQLNGFITSKQQHSERDQDLADAYYNRACYRIQLVSSTTEELSRNALKEEAYKDLEESLKIAPVNAVNARADEDFDPIRQEPRFRELVRDNRQPPPNTA
jgi:tetratricopeptide (TPR) repeat protein